MEARSMENKKLQSLLYKPLFIVFVIHSLSCPRAIAQETEDEREFDYHEESDKGPDQWGEIRPEWRMCGKGTMQSPIDMSNERVEVVSYFRELKRKYKPSNATIVNRGHDVMLKWEGGAGYIEINETQYELKQCHWHSPSEHTVNGRRFDLEVHLVHESQSNRSAVIGILYEFGRPDSFLSEVSEHIEAIAEDEEEKRVVGMVDPNHIRVGSLKYYRYIGSLTVPPCTENVVWTIVSKARTVSREQVNLLRDAVHDDYEVNARPVQPLNNREVKFYQPRLKFT